MMSYDINLTCFQLMQNTIYTGGLSFSVLLSLRADSLFLINSLVPRKVVTRKVVGLYMFIYYSACVKLYAFVRRIRRHVNNINAINVVIGCALLGFHFQFYLIMLDKICNIY